MQGQCDPSPSEYTDADSNEPNLVFYWGLQPGRSNPLDVQSLGDDISTNLNGYQGPVGSLKLFLVQASEMASDVDLPARSKEGTKACWKVHGENERRVPLFSQHHPYYMVGYVADAQGAQYLSGNYHSFGTPGSCATIARITYFVPCTCFIDTRNRGSYFFC